MVPVPGTTYAFKLRTRTRGPAVRHDDRIIYYNITTAAGISADLRIIYVRALVGEKTTDR